MDLLAPLGPVYQAGTLSGNPLAMAAGIATLQHLIAHEADIYSQLEQTTAAIADGVAASPGRPVFPLTTNRVGSMFTWFFTQEPVTDFTSAATSDTQAFGHFHRAMLEAGVWLPPASSKRPSSPPPTAPRRVALDAGSGSARRSSVSAFSNPCLRRNKLHPRRLILATATVP